MTETPRAFDLDRDGDRLVLALHGEWRLARLAALQAAFDALPPDALTRGAVCLDGRGLAGIDTAGALLLWRGVQAAGAAPEHCALEAFDPRHARILDLVRERLPQTGTRAPARRPNVLAQLGMQSEGLARLAVGHVAFLGLTLSEIARAVVRPSVLRRRELMAQFRQVCVNAIPVIVLVTFLIGTIIAYLLGLQAEQYGANIFVVDGVALGMVREFSPIIVATIVAGRSGAAFTAQLGTMRLTEETDAIRTLGLSPEQVLVVPRVLALVVSLPLLVFVGDLAGLLGAVVVSNLMLDITPATFVDRLHAALEARHYVIGLAKAPVFALFIAVIGCRMGVAVSRDTRSIGIHTTSTVVQSIVVVILLDALFAVLFQELDL
ncbi:MAG TPA: ABC transporter permease [Quisquiliibacterium sp.]|nr:ABC transporter permease [Quisquiliibacterium sp.]HQN13575.1 ABC transporter permease [Quisquiliibacterium sp.]HQP66906.1 ABC transporter permease [Quisquiliibacterium sp.]